MEAIRFGTINAARELGFTDAGAIAPNYVADIQFVDNLEFYTRPNMVLVAGKIVSVNGKLVEEITEHTSINVNTVKIPQITSPEKFWIKSDKEEENCLVFNASRASMVPNQPLVYKKFPVIDGHVVIPNLEENQYISVVNRHGNGNITTVICSDFNLKHGCVASTISHDSHNMTLAYRDPKDAYVAAKALEKVGGGMCFVENQEVKYILPLPVAGLMSELEAEELAPQIKVMDEWVSYASDGESPMLLAIAILALPVRPGIIITDQGVIRGETLQFVPQFKEKG